MLISRMNLIAMAVGFIILGLTTIYPVVSESEYLSETEESISGLAAINSICYCMNMKQFLILQFIISLVIMLFVSVFSCFLSAVTKSGVATIAIMFVLLLGPAFIPFSRESNILNHLNCLALVRVMDLREVLKQFFVFRIGGHIINLPAMSIIVYLSATAICICGLRRVYIFWTVRK